MVINRKMCLWENAAETQVAFRQWAGVHFSTVRQWDRRKHMAVEWKLTWLFSDSARHPVALSSVVGHTGSGQYGRKEEGLDSAKKKKNSSHLLSEQLHPPSHTPCHTLISHAIDWNPKRQDQDGAQSSLSMNSWLDVMAMWCVVTLRPFQVRGRGAVGFGEGDFRRARPMLQCGVLCSPTPSLAVSYRRAESCRSLIRSSAVLRTHTYSFSFLPEKGFKMCLFFSPYPLFNSSFILSCVTKPPCHVLICTDGWCVNSRWASVTDYLSFLWY